MPQTYNIKKSRYRPLMGTVAGYNIGQRLVKYMRTPASKSQTIGYGKKKYYKKQRRKNPIAKMQKQISSIKRTANSDQGTLVYRRLTADRIRQVADSVQGVGLVDLSNASILETVLGQLRYYNPSAPATLVTADGTTGAYYKRFMFTKVYTNIMIRNNYQVPVEATMYICAIKQDTNITPTTAWSNGMTDISNVTSGSLGTYPTDSNQFIELWKIAKKTTRRLNPGESMTLTYGVPSFTYDPSYADSHGSSYLTTHHNYACMIVVHGAVGHDTITAEVGKSQSGVDMFQTTTFKVEYPAGADIKYVYVDTSGVSTFTNAGVVSNMPVSDNQSYSQP